MKHKRISSIRTRLAWLVAACLVPAFIMAGALVYAYYGNEQAKSVRDASASVNALTFDVDRELVSLETVLFALATSPHLTSRDLVAFDRQARELVKDRRIENVILADTSGQQLSNTRRPAGTPLPRVGDPELVKRALFSQRPVISDLFIGQVLKQPLISIGVPIVRDDQVIYVLIASILPERFAELLMQQRVTGGLVELLDRNGKVIAQNRTQKNGGGPVGPTTASQ